MATLQEIESKKAELRKMGIAEFKISIDGNTLSENESISRSIDEKWSFFFVAVKDPYFRCKPGNMKFRIFQTSRETPTIPMGYYGMPSVAFDCYDGNPAAVAIAKIKELCKREYKTTVKEDEIYFSRVETAEEKQSAEATEQAEKDKYTPKETDTPEVKAIKDKIIKLEALSTKMKEANKAIRANDDNRLAALGFTGEQVYKLKQPDFCGRVGFPGYELTSISTKIRRLKSKIK